MRSGSRDTSSRHPSSFIIHVWRRSCLNQEAQCARLDVSRQRLIKLIDLLLPRPTYPEASRLSATRLDSGSHNASPSPRAVAVCNERCCSRAGGSVWSVSRPGLRLRLAAGSPRTVIRAAAPIFHNFLILGEGREAAAVR